MVRIPSAESAAERARWLAELTAALDEARDLVRRLAVEEARIDAIDLAARIEAVRSDVERMRLRRAAGARDFGPEWTKDIPWKLSA